MTLRQEIGAVMMVGFTGPITPAILADWRSHQFGGLIVVPINQNAPDPAAIRRLIQSVRGVMAHPVLTATNQEGGTVCFQETRVPCMAGARQAGAQGPGAVQSEMTSMSQGLKALGFDINFAPVADVWDGVHPFMSERSYGQNPHAVAQDVSAAVAGIHAAGLYATAKHFPALGTERTGIVLPQRRQNDGRGYVRRSRLPSRQAPYAVREARTVRRSAGRPLPDGQSRRGPRRNRIARPPCTS